MHILERNLESQPNHRKAESILKSLWNINHMLELRVDYTRLEESTFDLALSGLLRRTLAQDFSKYTPQALLSRLSSDLREKTILDILSKRPQLCNFELFSCKFPWPILDVI